MRRLLKNIGNQLPPGTIAAAVFGLALLFIIVSPVEGASKSLADLGPVQTDPNRLWTVMVYLDADNDLEPFALIDLEEMEFAKPPQGVELIVLCDRADGYSTAEGDWKQGRVIRIQSDKNEGHRSDVLADVGELNMGDGNVLAGFIGAAVKTFPAKHYALIMWDHGNGWAAHAVDHLAPDATDQFDKLTLPELRQGISQGLQAAGINKLDLIGFDMCLMAQVETAFELEGLADVMAASEASEPGDGWPYHLVAPLFADSRKTSRDIARGIVDAFDAFYREKHEPMATMSAFDLHQVGALAKAMDGFLSRVRSDLPRSWPSLTRAMFYSVSFSDPDDLRRGPQSLMSVDLGDTITNYALVSGTEQTPEFQAFRTALSNFVLATKASPRYGRSQGTSMYAPCRVNLFNAGYSENRFAKETGWTSTLRDLYLVQEKASQVPTIQGIQTYSVYRKQPVNEVIQLGQDGFKFSLSGQNILWALAHIGWRDPHNPRTLIFQKSFLGESEAQAGTKVKKKTREELLAGLTYPDGQSEITFRYDGTRLIVTNGEEAVLATMDMSDIGDLAAALTAVPIFYDHPETGKLQGRIYFDWQWKAAAVVLQVQQRDGSITPIQVNPPPDAVIYPLLQSFPDRGEPEYVVAGKLQWKDGLKLTVDLAPPGQYEVFLTVETLSGKTAVSRHAFQVAARDDDLLRAVRQSPASDYALENFYGEWELIDAEQWFRQGKIVSIGAFKKYEPHPKYKNAMKFSLYKPKGNNLMPGLDIVEIMHQGSLPHLRRYVLGPGGTPDDEYGVQMSLPVFDIAQGQYLLLEMDLVMGDMGVAIKRSGPTPKLATASSPSGTPPGGYPGTTGGPTPGAPMAQPQTVNLTGVWMTPTGEAVAFNQNQWAYYQNNQMVDGGTFIIQGDILTTHSAKSGQQVPYRMQLSGNQLWLQNQSGEVYQFYRTQ